MQIIMRQIINFKTMNATIKTIATLFLISVVAGASFSQEAAQVQVKSKSKTQNTAGVATQTNLLGSTVRTDNISVATSPVRYETGVESSKTQLQVQRESQVRFEYESTPTEIKIKATEEYNYLGINIRTQLNAGMVNIEIFDPKGNRQGIYTVVADETVESGDKTMITNTVSGSIAKQFRNPAKREWKVKATPAKAFGNVSVVTDQQSIATYSIVANTYVEKKE